jgi:hypothetical protein
MAEIVPRSITDLQNLFYGSLALNNSALSDQTEGSTLYTLARAFSALQADTDVRLRDATKAFFLSQAEGPDLDARVADYGLVRQPSTPASGYVLITPIDLLEIAPQTVLTEPQSTLQFITLNPNPISAAPLVETRVPVAAILGGSAGNLPAGTFLLYSSSIRVDCYVGTERKSTGEYCTPLSGGSNIETDFQLRIRAINYIQSRRGTTVGAIQSELLRDPSIEWAYIRERLPGLIEIWVDSPVPLGELSLRAIRSTVDNLRPAGVLASVFQANRLNIDIAVKLSVNAINSSELTNARVSSVVEAFLFQIPLGAPLDVQEFRYFLEQSMPELRPELVTPRGSLNLPDRTVPRIGRLTIQHSVL